jgi:hypothetical protein
MQYVDFEEVIAEAVTTIGAEGDDEIVKPFLRQIIYRGLQKLGDSELLLVDAKCYPKNLLIKKPKDYKKLDSIALYDSAGNLLPHVFHSGKRIYPETEGTTYVTEEGEEFCGPIDISEDPHNFVIGTNGTAVNHALVRYWKFPLDSNGLPLIREDEVEALCLYCRWRWSQRKNANQSEIQQNSIEWKMAADQCKALKKSTNSEQHKTVARLTNRMLPNFNRSRY